MIRQLYSQIRQRILDGLLAPGSRLPSSRELAVLLRISRNIVLEVFDLLYAEGFLETRQGAGTFVSQGAAFSRPPSADAPPVETVHMGYDCPKGVINFRAGTPDLALFPTRLWLKTVKEVFTMSPDEMLVYGHPEGRVELRRAISEYLLTQRDVNCHPDQILITGGTTQAINISAQVLLSEKKEVILEDPITRDIQLILKSYGARLFPVAVDGDGMCTAELPQHLQPACIYVTPSHQFPIGGTLPIQRRIELLRYAQHCDAYIIEDDYDSEFRFDGPPLSSLHGLSPDRVVYIGTFSKTLCPALRIGYLVLPPQLINLCRNHKWQSDLHNEVTSQLALARFIEQGHYLRHINRMRKHYLSRRRTLLRAIAEHFPENARIIGSATGLHLVASFPGYHFSEVDFNRFEAAGVRVYPVESHAIQAGRHTDKLMLGYGNLSTEEIHRGIDMLATCLNESQRADWRAGL